MFYSQLALISDDPGYDECYEEFWVEAFRAQERALQRISRANSCNSQWTEAKRMLSNHGWADVAYFFKKQNRLYQEILGIIEEKVRSMRDDEDMQFSNCIWMMESNRRQDDLIQDIRSLKIFILLPSPAKAERYVFNNSCGRGGVYFLGIHFPTVFPRCGTWPNASPEACRLLKHNFRHEIVNNVDEIRRITFASPDTISQAEIREALYCIKQERWNRLIKIYLILFRESGTAWRDYLNYLRQKGAWID